MKWRDKHTGCLGAGCPHCPKLERWEAAGHHHAVAALTGQSPPAGFTPPTQTPCRGCLGVEEFPDEDAAPRVIVTADGLGDHVLGLCVLPGLAREHGRVVYQVKHRRYLPWVELFETGAVYASAPSPTAAKTWKPHDTYAQQLDESTARGRANYAPCSAYRAIVTYRMRIMQ